MTNGRKSSNSYTHVQTSTLEERSIAGDQYLNDRSGRPPGTGLFFVEKPLYRRRTKGGKAAIKVSAMGRCVPSHLFTLSKMSLCSPGRRPNTPMARRCSGAALTIVTNPFGSNKTFSLPLLSTYTPSSSSSTTR